MPYTLENLAASPCSNPQLGLEEALGAYAALGYRKFEVFTSWTRSHFDIYGDPAYYRELGQRYNLTFSSLHGHPVGDDLDATLPASIDSVKFAAALDIPVVLFKATSRENYIKAAGPFLDAIADLPVTPVLQNHYGSPISSLEDFREVLDGIADDRMKTLLEVGHFHSAGVSWREGYALLQDSIALVHIKDQLGRQSVPFGQGEIDLPGLFAQLDSVGYNGDFVVEMEVADSENTLDYLRDALAYLQQHCLEAHE